MDIFIFTLLPAARYEWGELGLRGAVVEKRGNAGGDIEAGEEGCAVGR